MAERSSGHGRVNATACRRLGPTTPCSAGGQTAQKQCNLMPSNLRWPSGLSQLGARLCRRRCPAAAAMPGEGQRGGGFPRARCHTPRHYLHDRIKGAGAARSRCWTPRDRRCSHRQLPWPRRCAQATQHRIIRHWQQPQGVPTLPASSPPPERQGAGRPATPCPPCRLKIPLFTLDNTGMALFIMERLACAPKHAAPQLGAVTAPQAAPACSAGPHRRLAPS